MDKHIGGILRCKDAKYDMMEDQIVTAYHNAN